MKILAEGIKQEEQLYRVECKHCHCVFEGTIEEISEPFDSSRRKSIEELRCPCCHSYLRYLEEERKIYTRPLYPVLSDFDNPKKIGLQKKENI